MWWRSWLHRGQTKIVTFVFTTSFSTVPLNWKYWHFDLFTCYFPSVTRRLLLLFQCASSVEIEFHCVDSFTQEDPDLSSLLTGFTCFVCCFLNSFDLCYKRHSDVSWFWQIMQCTVYSRDHSPQDLLEVLWVKFCEEICIMRWSILIIFRDWSSIFMLI